MLLSLQKMPQVLDTVSLTQLRVCAANGHVKRGLEWLEFLAKD